MWQPIETAPKNRPILAWFPGEVAILAIRWDTNLSVWKLHGVSLTLGDWGEPTKWVEMPSYPTREDS